MNSVPLLGLVVLLVLGLGLETRYPVVPKAIDSQPSSQLPPPPRPPPRETAYPHAETRQAWWTCTTTLRATWPRL